MEVKSLKKPKKLKLKKTEQLLRRAERVIPSSTQTFSKGPSQWIRGVTPSYLTKGEGAWVWDVDDNKFLDYLMALGPIVLGYGNKNVEREVIKQLKDGLCFSQMHPLEVEVAELLVKKIPCAEMVRFGKNGSDVTTAAVRAARAYTGRERVLFCGYHGWHDWYIGSTTRDSGVPQATKKLASSFNYNDIDSLAALFKESNSDIACVIMEAVGVELPVNNFLGDVKEITHNNGALLVFDEIINGCRVAVGGAQELEGVIPDLACFGKALGNGFPISAIVGAGEIMEIFDQIFFSGTFGGETISLAACKATIDEIERLSVIEKNWDYGRNLTKIINGLIVKNNLEEDIKLVGYDVRSILTFPHEDELQSRIRRSFFMQESVKRGLLFYGVHLPTFAHQREELEFSEAVYGEVIELFASLINKGGSSLVREHLEGPIIEPIFRKP